ncbi:MAG: hypothetical protein L6R40_002608 [Gallowayella cf. fulva]|nr:MAG: hypothetical protein L6R40_002608 [Xanthomendoza cf. fulva]
MPAHTPQQRDAEELPSENYRSLIREARHHLGEDAPFTVHNRTNCKPGATLDVILAYQDGEYPADDDSKIMATMTAPAWGTSALYWTLDIAGERVILKGIGAARGLKLPARTRVFRQWLGVGKDIDGFGNKNIAFSASKSRNAPIPWKT